LKASEIRVLTEGEIIKALEEAHERLFRLRFQLATRQLANHRELYRVKRNIARIKTILREKELGVE